MTTSTVKPGLSAALASPYTPIGYVNGTPIYSLRGGRSGGGIQFAVGDDSGDDPEFEDEDDGDDEEEDDEPAARQPAKRGKRADDEGDDGDTDWTPPSRESFQRMEDALQRANKEAARHRRAGKAMRDLGIDDLPTYLSSVGIDPATGKPYGDDVVDPDTLDDDDGGSLLDEEPPARGRRGERTSDRDIVRQVRAAEQRGRRAAMDELTPILAQQAAEAAMRAAGFDGDQDEMELALRMIDTRQVDVDIDADGFEVIGIDDQVETIRQRMPRLFKQENGATTHNRTREDRAGGRSAAAGRKRTGAAAVDGGGRGRQPAKEPTWEQRMAEQLDRFGKR